MSEVIELRDQLKSLLGEMSVSIRTFCEYVAVEEGEDDPELEKRILSKVRKQLTGKGRKLNPSDYERYLRYLSLMPEFSRVGKVILPNAKTLISNQQFADDLAKAFRGI